MARSPGTGRLERTGLPPLWPVCEPPANALGSRPGGVLLSVTLTDSNKMTTKPTCLPGEAMAYMWTTNERGRENAKRHQLS